MYSPMLETQGNTMKARPRIGKLKINGCNDKYKELKIISKSLNPNLNNFF